ncbi:4-hydroxy-tetrahydrodipicolinate reductase [Aeoliella sp. ICT_H6.2]|uniref:4-hydroxy-tetrahydrodipicolinate reductase n=1 Tax=Aeoliella straminimaris TaxID=2954799 RepID=A0A9X2F7B4_9BACT|nr:4-hydroxy-tetrahydrodipicolinate reductase [Aeoliella straminimaris]MCO6043560.1 4-hydroxy-tetrahydrodipicolinate reductase [Aeoliella straminimaris]
MPIEVAIHGAGGRMGQRLIALGTAAPNIKIVAAIESAMNPKARTDAGVLAGVGEIGVPLSPEWPDRAGAVIDFSLPAATDNLVANCLEHKTPLVFATTGLSDKQEELIRTASEQIPIVKAASMSMAVNLTMKLTEIASRALKDHPSGADVEIIERHHRFKEDAPSGTALAFGKIVADAMGQSQSQHGRSGKTGARPHDEIGYHAIRTGDNPGEHTIIFGLLGETIELRVAATNRDCYAHGAFAAAEWLQGKPPGLYNMQDVLGLNSL